MKTFFLNLWNKIKTAYKTQAWLKWVSILLVCILASTITTVVILNGNNDMPNANSGSSSSASVNENSSNENSSSEDSSSSEEPEQNLMFTVSGNMITGLTEYGKANCENLIIPSKIDGKEITTIGEMAFLQCENIKSVILPDSVTTIQMGAFGYCTNLKNITLSNSITSIEENVFYDCNQLQYIQKAGINYLGSTSNPYLYLAGASSTDIVSATIEENCKIIAYQAFYKCKELVSVSIPDSVIAIEEEAFFRCEKLTDISIPNSVTSIKYEAFNQCYALPYTEYGNAKYIGNVDNPYLVLVELVEESTTCSIHKDTRFLTDYFVDAKITNFTVDENNAYFTSIDGNLYSKDENVLIRYATAKTDSTFKIPNSVTTIGHSAFYYAHGLTSVTIPDSVTYIDAFAFRYCDHLTSLSLPNSVTYIGENAFSYCSSLPNIILPNSLTYIGEDAFDNCRSLPNVTIPASVTYIGNGAFQSCSSLTNITVDANNPNYISIDGNLYSKDQKVLLQYAIGKTDNYFIIPDSVTAIEGWSFYGCEHLIGVTIPNSVTHIGYYAFNSCRSLTNVRIPQSVTVIDSGAFGSCFNLQTIYFDCTIAEYHTIEKGSNWNWIYPNTCTVICADGQITE